jgi:AraC family transcriptional regulator
MKPRFENFDAKTYVGMQIELPHDLSTENRTLAMKRLWPEFMDRSSQIRGAIGQTKFGMITPGETTVEYLAAAETENNAPVPKGFTKTQSEKGKFAIFTHRGPLDTIQDTFDLIFSEWLPSCGLELRDDSMFEIYGERFDRDSPHAEIDIALPIG